MRTPSLARRVTIGGVTVLALLVLVLDVVIYVGVRSELLHNLSEVLDTRLDIARGLVDDVPLNELGDRLTALGVPASITTDDGRVIDAEPAVPRFGAGGIPSTLPEPRVQATETMGDIRVTVFATRAGIQAALRRLLLVETLGTAGALLAAVLLVRRSTSVALQPLGDVVGAASRTAGGARGERLRPDDPDTELGRLAVSFDAMLEELEAALANATESEERSQRFLADAAHQLRTPIAGIRASVESLIREDDEAVRDRLIGNLVRETGRAARLLANLLTVARLDSGKALGPRQSVDLAELIGGEVARARDLAPHLRVALHVQPGPRRLVADAAELREALGNLLDNARRHATSHVDVHVVTDASSATVRVHDDGPGLPDDHAIRAFDRFASFDGRGGSGLGLPIARAVARSHGGDLVWAAGTFELRLPRGDGQRA